MYIYTYIYLSPRILFDWKQWISKFGLMMKIPSPPEPTVGEELRYPPPPPGPQFLTATLLCYGPICLMTHVSCKWWTASRKRNCVHRVMMFIVFMRLLYDDEESIGVELRSGFHEFTFYEVFKHHAEMSGFMMRYDIVAGEESHENHVDSTCGPWASENHTADHHDGDTVQWLQADRLGRCAGTATLPWLALLSVSLTSSCSLKVNESYKVLPPTFVCCFKKTGLLTLD